MKKTVVINLLKHIAAIGIVAYGIIIAAMYAIPHLPIANKQNFQALVQVQISIDRYQEDKLNGNNMLLFMGSSVVERGVAENYIDSLIRAKGITTIRTTNSAVGGFFADANLVLLRTLLANGIRPQSIVYGIFIDDLNGGSTIHNTFAEKNPTLEVRQKNLLNVLRFGARALAPIIDVGTLHMYLFALNNAYREVPKLSAFQRLTFGVNYFKRDSNYRMDTSLLNQLESIYLLCKEYNIPFAIFNTPLRPTIESPADLPYSHRREAYEAVAQLAHKHSFPIWNLDQPGFFTDADFRDTYHVTPLGARKMSKMVLQKIFEWKSGTVIQDPANDFTPFP